MRVILGQDRRWGWMRRIWVGLIVSFLTYVPGAAGAEIGIWTSARELAGVPTTTAAWREVLAAANRASPTDATVEDQDSNNNVQILAAAIVYARLGEEKYRQAVNAALTHLVNRGRPGGRTLAWGRETAAYVMAADLVSYRTSDFERWQRNIAHRWRGDDGRTLRQTFNSRANNWGAMAFASLCAIYRYLGEDDMLAVLRDSWVQALVGSPRSSVRFGRDRSWHPDPRSPKLISPADSAIDGVDVSGIIPDDMRRGGSFRVPPGPTEYPWEHLQGLVTAARILDRAGLSIWSESDRAILRAVRALEVVYARDFGSQWKASGDDTWLLPFIDKVYGSAFTLETAAPSRLWGHGKVAGWPYVAHAD